MGEVIEHWPEVEWEGGYPVAEDDDFQAWSRFPLNFEQAAAFLLRELPAAMENCCASCTIEDAFDDVICSSPVKRISFSTGGWSGAESLIGFIEKRFDTNHFMVSWRRGGHYVFEIPVRYLPTPTTGGDER